MQVSRTKVLCYPTVDCDVVHCGDSVLILWSSACYAPPYEALSDDARLTSYVCLTSDV